MKKTKSKCSVFKSTFTFAVASGVPNEWTRKGVDYYLLSSKEKKNKEFLF